MTRYDSPGGRVAEPALLGTERAVAAYRAGEQVAMIPTMLPGGRPAFRLMLLHDEAPVYSPRAAAPAPAVREQHRPDPSSHRGPPMFTPGQKWVLIGGAVATVLLLAVWLVIQAISAIGSLLAGGGSILVGGALLIAVLYFIVTRRGGGGGGGGVQSVNIGAKSIGKITFK